MTLAAMCSFMATFWGLLATLLMASLLELLRSDAVPEGRGSIDLASLLDLDNTGHEFGEILWSLLGPVPNKESALVIVGALLLLTTGVAVASNIAGRWLWMSVRISVNIGMHSELLAHIVDLPMAFHVRHRMGAVIARLQDVTSITYAIPVIFHSFLRSPFVVGATLLLMVQTSVMLTAVTVVTALMYVFANFVLGHLVRRSFIQQSITRGSVMSLIQEALLSIRVVKTFGAERAEVKDITDEMRLLVKEEVRGDLYGAQLPSAVTQVLSAAAGVVIAVAGLRLVAARELTEQGLVMFILTAVAMLASAGLIAQAIVVVYTVSAAASRVLELWRSRPSLEDGTRPAGGFHEALAISDVSFGYGDAEVLSEVSLTIRPGEVIGIVGPSGSGKSTLADLILRLYDPQSGRITLDGTDIREFTQGSYRRLFGVVSQETLLFNDSVRSNIAYGRTGISDEDIVAAAKAAHAHEFICELPDGYDTIVGERGTRLSGGQRQRIAIARAIVTKPSILILDEATSSLDNESERLVQAAIERVVRGCTALVIAHRLSTLRNADRIVVLDAGRVTGVASHDQLLQRSGLYRQLHEAGVAATSAP